jgi:hypothetical protein
MMDPSTKQEFRVSVFGRFYYLLWVVVSFEALYVVVAALIKNGRVPSLSDVVVFTVLCVLFVPAFLYSFSQLFRRSPRFTITKAYHGLYVRRTIPWNQIQDCSLGGGGKGPNLLRLRLTGRTWWKGWVFFDVSLMSPNYRTLYSVVCEYVKHTPNNRFQATPALTRRRA